VTPGRGGRDRSRTSVSCRTLGVSKRIPDVSRSPTHRITGDTHSAIEGGQQMGSAARAGSERRVPADDGRETFRDRDGALHRVVRTRYAYQGRHRTMSEAAFDRLIDTPELRGDTMRLALLLIVTAERSTMIITMTRADMAQRLGVQPTNVSRLMSKLTAVGLVVTEGAVRKINPTWAFGADSRAHGDAVTTHYRNGGVGVTETPPQVKAPKRASTTATRTTATGTKRRNLRAVPERATASHPSADPQVPGQMDVYDAGA
jgi:hypothetical protein